MGGIYGSHVLFRSPMNNAGPIEKQQ